MKNLHEGPLCSGLKGSSWGSQISNGEKPEVQKEDQRKREAWPGGESRVRGPTGRWSGQEGPGDEQRWGVEVGCWMLHTGLAWGAG